MLELKAVSRVHGKGSSWQQIILMNLPLSGSCKNLDSYFPGTIYFVSVEFLISHKKWHGKICAILLCSFNININ
jgi:hypothetical protein